MRDPAPPYANEGPHALWHASEDPSLERFVPRMSATAELGEPLVWAGSTASARRPSSPIACRRERSSRIRRSAATG